MASSPHLPPPSKIVQTLRYFDKYDYPLTREELIYWQASEKADNKDTKFEVKDGFYFLPGRQKIINLRKQREKISVGKWVKARQVGERLKKFPFIQAVCVTGSLAMNNAKQEDDIDLMLITQASTLWIARFFVVMYLKLTGNRRAVLATNQYSDKVCDNLWLDENNLHISQHDLYQAHEILQAKQIWDRSDAHRNFLESNAWHIEFLPNTHKSSKKRDQQIKTNYLTQPVNYFFYLLQYMYMLPRKTSEHVAPGYAFFHPQKPVL